MQENEKNLIGSLPVQLKSAAGSEADLQYIEGEQCLCILRDRIEKNFQSAAVFPFVKASSVEEEKELLWKAICLFEEYTFQTQSGLEFSYTLKRNKAGVRTNELYFSRKKKGITRGTIFISYDKVAELRKVQNTPVPALTTPKELGTFGASYVYGVFLHFGLIAAAPRKKSRS